jgi:hypothetical protein
MQQVHATFTDSFAVFILLFDSRLVVKYVRYRDCPDHDRVQVCGIISAPFDQRD